MKATNWMTMIVLASGLALGQAPSGAKSPAKPASQAPPAAAKAPAKAAPASSAAAPKKSAPAKAATAKAPAAAKTPVAAKAKTPAAPKAKAPKAVTAAKKEKAPAAKPVEAKGITTPGKRDPFISVIVARGGPSADCSGGKRCLVPEQIALRGIIKTPTKWIAMVETPAKKTYYLYENDAIYNGVVAKITGDSVVFRVQALDNLGHTVSQDIVKRVSAPVI